MNEQQTPNFLDARTIFAIIMVGLGWVLWQGYLEKKYPETYKPKVEQAAPPAANSGTNPTSAITAPSELAAAIAPTGAMPLTGPSEKLMTHEDATWKFSLSSKGMGIRHLALKTYTDRDGKPFAIGSPNDGLFQTSVKGVEAPLDFTISSTEPGEYKGEATYQGARITKIIRVRPQTYTFETEVSVQQMPSGFPGLVNSFSEYLHPAVAGSFLMGATAEKNEVYVAFGTTDERSHLKPDEVLSKTYSDVAVLGLGTHYFATAILDQSDLIPTASFMSRPEKQTVVAGMAYAPVNNAGAMQLSYRSYAGPKSMTILRAIDPRMGHMIDFGKFGFIARPLLALMKWIYSVVGNWGFAIILLTILVRLIVLPINIFSFRSMKAMQAIQPQLKAIREKYKDDSKALNTETMLLMKQHKVNPLGGCLPMLLQIPVFFALYAVLGQSIELYKAPFMFWIHDLSLRDPLYVLPVLMGISMFLQQKLTPTTMDPAQAKVMMFMPVIFAVFMLGLPSGLTLYIFVSTIFGIGQQFIFMRDRAGIASAPQGAKA